MRRPLIEDKLGQLTSDLEDNNNLLSLDHRTDSRISEGRYSSDNPTTPELDNTLVSDTVNAETAAAELLAHRMLLEVEKFKNFKAILVLRYTKTQVISCTTLMAVLVITGLKVSI